MTMPEARAAHLPAAKALLAAHPLIDGHNDLPWVIRQAGYLDRLADYDLTVVHAESDTDLPRLSEGMVATQVLAAFLPTLIDKPEIVTQEQIDLILRIEALHPDRLHPVRHPDDVATARRLAGSASSRRSRARGAGRFAGPLRLWQMLGVRIVTLCRTRRCPGSIPPPTRHPASMPALRLRCGDRAREMNRLGLIIDMAHVAPHAMPHVLAASQAPVMITHSCAAALCAHPRNTRRTTC